MVSEKTIIQSNLKITNFYCLLFWSSLLYNLVFFTEGLVLVHLQTLFNQKQKKIFNKPTLNSWLEQRFSEIDLCFFKFSFDSWFSESRLLNQVLFTKSRIDCRSKMGRSQSQFKRLILPKQSEFLSRATIYVLCHDSFEASQKNAITSSKLLSFFFGQHSSFCLSILQRKLEKST